MLTNNELIQALMDKDAGISISCPLDEMQDYEHLCAQAAQRIADLTWHTHKESPWTDGFYFAIIRDRMRFHVDGLIHYDDFYPTVIKWDSHFGGWICGDDMYVEAWMPVPGWDYRKDGNHYA